MECEVIMVQRLLMLLRYSSIQFSSVLVL